MTERHNTVVCAFDLASPKITAHDIHEWIFNVLRIPENSVQLIQIDGIKRHVYIKLADAESIQALLQDTAGHAEYKYPTGELTIVNIALAGLGTKRIRVANLTPETSNDNLKAALAPYGKIMNIQNERWSKIYRYPVDNGVRQVTIVLSRHAPSRLTVAGQQVLLSYEGQPPTCYGCGESDHMYQGCPKRRKMTSTRIAAKADTYAAIVMGNEEVEGNPQPEKVTGNNTVEDGVPAPSTIVDRSATSCEDTIAGEQREPPDHTNILAQPATLVGIDDVTDNSQGTADVEHGQRMEVSEPQGDSPPTMTVSLKHLLLSIVDTI